MNLQYIFLRLIRHFIPQKLAHFLLRQHLIIKPGLETSAPGHAVARYEETLRAAGRTLQGQRVMVFGYGGNYAIACGLLNAGAAHITLLDKYASPDDVQNRLLLPEFEKYLLVQGGLVSPDPQYIDLLASDVRDLHQDQMVKPYDIILSNSVFEHLDDVPGTCAAFSGIMQPDGCTIHYVDLRDHYFKFPFEMLTFSEKTWQHWLNPGSNLNRYRLGDYQSVFKQHFEDVALTVLERDPANFENARQRIRGEFLTGNTEQDAVTLIRIFAAMPRLQDS